jgi:DnaJ family protein C protein 1
LFSKIWTDDDLSKLTKLMKRFPGGSNERWEKIADILERYPWEVTKMAKKVKDNAYMVSMRFEGVGHHF